MKKWFFPSFPMFFSMLFFHSKLPLFGGKNPGGSSAANLSRPQRPRDRQGDAGDGYE